MFHPLGPTFFELARQALSSTETGYDLLAPKFDYTPFRTPDIIFAAFNRKIQDEGPFDDVLDVGCGTGAAMAWIMPYCHGRLVGLDISRGMLNQATKNLKRLVHSSARETVPEFIRGQALDMPFENEFDLAISFGTFGHILPADELKFIGQLHKSLRPGGKFAFVTSQMPSLISLGYWLARGFNTAMHIRNLLHRPPFVMYYLTFLWPDVERKLTKAGFRVQATRLFPDEPKLGLYQFVVATKSAKND